MARLVRDSTMVPPETGAGPRPPLDLERAFHLYASYVAAVALRLLGRSEEVDDVIQEVFLSALKGLAQLQDPEAIKGWLATVTVRVSSRHLARRRLWRRLGLDRPVDYTQAVDPAASPEQRALLARVYRILDGLPVEERVAWALCHVQGERLDAVAQRLGCSLATAKRRIAAAHATIERETRDE
jgi:RNA polymerase sigma-70 factor (ECF subfamily)